MLFFCPFMDKEQESSFWTNCPEVQIKKKMELTASLPNSDAYGRAWLAYGIYGLIEEWIGRGMVESPSEMNMIIIKSVNPN